MGKRGLPSAMRGWLRYVMGAAIGVLSGGMAASADPFAQSSAVESTHPIPRVPSGSGGPTPTGPKPSPTVSLTKKPTIVTHAPPQPTRTPVVARKRQLPKSGNTPKPATPTTIPAVTRLVAFLLGQVGKPYVYGATGPAAYDCSGLVQTALARVGVYVPRTSEEQSATGHPVSLDQLQPGDLLFWEGRPGTATHSAIYIGSGLYVAAENPRVGVVEYSLAFYSPDFARRL